MKLTFRIILIILMTAGLPYPFCAIYDFPPSEPFRGNVLFNPYTQTNGKWMKGNFHGHSHAWGGLTDGANERDNYFKAYRELGYEIVGLSNYQQISPPFPGDNSYIPIYEHGWNVFKRHHLVIGAHRVVWQDFPLFQTIHQKQFMLNRIKPTTDLLGVAHPQFGHVTPEDFTRLTGYDLIEVLNHYRLSVTQWDSALSTGHPSWIIADDDTHNVTKPSETGRYWTMVHTRTPNGVDIIRALRNGEAYGVAGQMGVMDNGLAWISTDSMTMTIKLDSVASEIRFIGDGGKLRKAVVNCDSASYQFSLHDSYIRTEVASPKTILYLNPVLRTGGGLPNPVATVNPMLTALYWLGWVIAYTVAVFLFIKLRRK